MLKRVYGKLETMARRVLPPLVFARGMAFAGRVLSRVRPGEFPTGVTQVDGLTVIRCTDGEITTVHPIRINRYTRGIERRLGQLLRRYQGQRLTPDDVVVDIGANVGEFSLAAARVAKQVVAVEPDPVALAALRRNVAGHGNILVVDAVVWSERATIPFYSSPDGADSSTIEPAAASATLHREAVPLDELCRELDVTPTFLKMDAEGAEPEVLAGAVEVLAGLRTVAVDCGPERHGQPTHEPVMEVLGAAGLQVQHHTEGESRYVVVGVRQQ